MVHQWSAGQVGRDQLNRVGVALVVGGPPAQEKGVEEVFSLAEGDVWKNRAAGAEGRAGVRNRAVAVEKANLPIEAPVTAACCISTKVLTLCWLGDVIEVSNLRIGFTSDILKLVAARLCDRGSFWSCHREAAIWGVCTGGCVRVALCEKEALTALVRGEGGKQELVAVNVGLALLLAFDLVVQVKGGSDNVGDGLKRAEEAIVEQVTLAGLQVVGGNHQQQKEEEELG